MLFIYNLLFSLIINAPTKVYINLEKINPLIYHTVITFKNNHNLIRYDFRAFNNNNNYLTTEDSRKNKSLMFPNLDSRILDMKAFSSFRNYVSENSYNILLGETNYSLNEIIILEEKLNKNYILGINDCRHYVNKLCIITLNSTIPIWDLEKLIK